MSQDEIVEFLSALPGVVAVMPDQSSGDPAISWGDSFFFYDPDGTTSPTARQPFATIVTKDYPGDVASELDAVGRFRLNIAVGRTVFERVLGYAPTEPAESPVDYAAADRVIPHPVYAAQGWVAIVSPTEASDDVVRDLVGDAYELASERHRRRGR